MPAISRRQTVPNLQRYMASHQGLLGVVWIGIALVQVHATMDRAGPDDRSTGEVRVPRHDCRRRGGALRGRRQYLGRPREFTPRQKFS